MKGKADIIGITAKRRAITAGQNGSGFAGKAEEGACLVALDARDVFNCGSRFLLSFNIKHLATRHAILSRSLGEFKNESTANFCIRMCIFMGQNFKGECQQGITGQYRCSLVKFFVRSWLAAPQVVVIHCWQIIMDEGIAVHAFERCPHPQRTGVRYIEHACGFDHQKRPQAFASPQRSIAHGA